MEWKSELKDELFANKEPWLLQFCENASVFRDRALNYLGGFSETYTVFCNETAWTISFVNEATARSDF
jgi:hypothetical protein